MRYVCVCLGTPYPDSNPFNIQSLEMTALLELICSKYYRRGRCGAECCKEIFMKMPSLLVHMFMNKVKVHLRSVLHVHCYYGI